MRRGRRSISTAVGSTVIAMALLVALPTPALGAMWMRISLNPSTPTAGEAVSVTVLTFYATQNLCWDDPRITPIPSATWYGGDRPISLGLEMVVVESRQRFTVPLVQRQRDGAYWDGTIIFPSGGQWQLYAKRAGAAPEPTSADRCDGMARTVDVRSVGPAASPNAGVNSSVAFPVGIVMALIAGAIFLAVAAVAGLRVVVTSRLRR